jgi:hypothetical protein
MTDLALRPEGTPPALLRPVASPRELLAMQDDVAQLIQQALKSGVDYGTIPGTGDKPSLFKAGAERINLAFGAHGEYVIVEKEIDHDRSVRFQKRKKVWRNQFKGDREKVWETEEGESLGLYRYVVSCRLMRDGRVLAEGVGSCSTLESKYVDRPRDCENTVLKMAQKRAYVAATLNAYGLSNRFTMDVEDRRPPPERDEAPAPPPRASPAAPSAPTIDAEATPVASGAYDDDVEMHRKVLIGLAQRHGIRDGKVIMQLRRDCLNTPLENLDRSVAAFVQKQSAPS